jgi:hypothetical protein
MDSVLKDKCCAYIEDKDCSYLAKEGFIVYYASPTGRKADYMWNKLTIAETLRIIRAMRLSTPQAKELREHHLIAAFQELDKVYEFGVKTRHSTAKGVFNYSEHSEMSVGDEAMAMMVETLQMQGFTAILMKPVLDLYDCIQTKLKLNLTTTECRELMYKHFESSGYVMKTGSKRPLIDNKKQPAIMMANTKPVEVVGIHDYEATKIIAKIYGELV